MTTPIKNPTAWRPASGAGYLVNNGVINIVDQNSKTITDQLVSPITDTGSQVMPKNPSVWVQTS